ncbi:unnamed protein product [Trichogramma brassicae]|uniref:Uncharacterized protein n=1 Tax=Trichogramma brassicae TaxID=86971 RepID=A0A6H5IT77_9HYME|nr:unnamed protein product [Trichogramma brassicae]
MAIKVTFPPRSGRAQKLELEAPRHTQGRTEPVIITFIVCSRSHDHRQIGGAVDITAKIRLAPHHNTCYRRLQKQVPRYKARSIDEFVELARDAENLHSAEKLYQPPIPSNLSMMPPRQPGTNPKLARNPARRSSRRCRSQSTTSQRRSRSYSIRSCKDSPQRLRQRRRLPRVTVRTTRKGRCHPR